MNASDLATLGLNWKKTWSPTLPSGSDRVAGVPAFSSVVVPEPGSFILLASAALAFAGRTWVRRQRVTA